MSCGLLDFPLVHPRKIGRQKTADTATFERVICPGASNRGRFNLRGAVKRFSRLFEKLRNVR